MSELQILEMLKRLRTDSYVRATKDVSILGTDQKVQSLAFEVVESVRQQGIVSLEMVGSEDASQVENCQNELALLDADLQDTKAELGTHMRLIYPGLSMYWVGPVPTIPFRLKGEPSLSATEVGGLSAERVTQLVREQQQQILGGVAALVVASGVNPLARDEAHTFYLEEVPEPLSLRRANAARALPTKTSTEVVLHAERTYWRELAAFGTTNQLAEDIRASEFFNPVQYMSFHSASSLRKAAIECGLRFNQDMGGGGLER